MTKYLLIFALTALAGCGSNPNSNAPTDSTTTQSTFPDEHSSRTALDYAGTYTGMLPCADCEGLETQITLEDNGTFTKKTTYLGKSTPNVFEEQGTFSWDTEGQRITLEGQDAPNQYFVGENTLMHLDMEGRKIEGSLAAMYVLKK